MLLTTTITSVDAVLFLLAAAILFQILRKSARPPKPPGPPGYPIIGNLLDLPSDYEWRTFSKWGEKYGDFMSVSALGTTTVIINSYKRSMEIFEDPRKTSIYSSRPYVAMAGDLMGFGEILGLLPYGPKLRNYRRFFQSELGTKAKVENFYWQEEQQARVFIRRALGSPGEILDHVFHHASTIVLRIAYAYEAKETNDQMVITNNEAMDAFNQSVLPGQFWCNQIPTLRFIPDWVPGAGFKRYAAQGRMLYKSITEIPFQYTKDQMAAGNAEESFVTKWLKKGLSSSDQKDLMHAAGSMFGAGGETTAITLYFFLIILAQHPEVQKKARAEVDRAVGRERLPTFEDRDKMPYLEALTKEVMRCHPVVPTCLPHATMEDDIHDGYFIPKGSIVLGNIWQMCNDPEVYSKPEIFNVERFLGDNPEADPGLVTFGFGRRVCPGRLLAEATLYITMSMILWSLDVSPVEVDGKTSPPVYIPVTGVVSRVEAVKLHIAPRTDKVAEMMSSLSR